MVLGFGNNFNMFGSMGGFMNSNPLSFLGMGGGIGNPFMSVLGGGTYCNSIFGGGMFTDKCGRPNYDAMAGWAVGSTVLNMVPGIISQVVANHKENSSTTISNDIVAMENKKQEYEKELKKYNDEMEEKTTNVTDSQENYNKYSNLVSNYESGQKATNDEIIKNWTSADEDYKKNENNIKAHDNAVKENQEYEDNKANEKKYKAELKEATDAKETLQEKIDKVQKDLNTINSQIEEAQRQLAGKTAKNSKKLDIDDDEYSNTIKSLDNASAKTLEKALNFAIQKFKTGADTETAKKEVIELYEKLALKSPKSVEPYEEFYRSIKEK